MSELRGVLEVTNSIVGIVVSYDEFSVAERKEILSFIKSEFPPSRLVPTMIFSSQDPSNIQEIPASDFVQVKNSNEDSLWQNAYDKFFEKMTPEGLDRMLLHSLNLVLPTFFPGVGGFTLGQQAHGGYNYQLNYSMSAGDIVGMCSIRVKWQAVLSLIPQDKKEKAWDIIKEAFNQALGVIIQNIVKLGIDMKLGLPTVFDLARVPYVQTMKFYPSVHSVDTSDTFACSIGFYHLGNEQLFDLSKSDPTNNSDEIEFL